MLGRNRSKSRQRRGKWSERESAEEGEGSGMATKQGIWKIGLQENRKHMTILNLSPV